MTARRIMPMRRGAGFVLLPVVLLLSLVAAMAYLGHREVGMVSAAADGATDQDKARYAAEAGLHRAISKMHSTGCAGTYPIILFSSVQDTAFDGGKYYAYAGTLSGSPTTVYSTGTYGDASITLTRANVPMHDAATYTVTLQPDAASGIDTYLKNSGSTNFGTATDLKMSAGTEVPLIRFNTSSIPTGAHVTSATLALYATAAGAGGTATVHRVLRDSTEAATWTTSDGSTAWSQAGGDFHSTAVATATLAGSNAWTNWDLTPLADRWVKGSLPNQGVVLQTGAAGSSWLFASSDSATVSQRPKLTVTFQPPCGWTPPDTVLTLAPLADSDIDFDLPNSNFGLQPDLYLSRGFEAHPLLQFDTTAVAAGKTITKATLRLYFSKLGTGTKTNVALVLNVHAVTKAWEELEATWEKRVLLANWKAQGGDYRNTATTAQTLPANSLPGVWLEFDVTTLAQEWVDGVTANNGLTLVLPTASTEELIFSSREALLNMPQLVLSYR